MNGTEWTYYENKSWKSLSQCYIFKLHSDIKMTGITILLLDKLSDVIATIDSKRRIQGDNSQNTIKFYDGEEC